MRRWYGTLTTATPRGKVQIETQVRVAASGRDALTLPEHVLRLAAAEYDRQHPGQPYERMQERGGLGVLEVVGLLADYVERLGGKPSLPSEKDGLRWVMPPDPMKHASDGTRPSDG